MNIQCANLILTKERRNNMPTIKRVVRVELEKPARKSGGDRYQGKLDSKDWQIYLPQSISRATGMAAKKFTVTIESEE